MITSTPRKSKPVSIKAAIASAGAIVLASGLAFAESSAPAPSRAQPAQSANPPASNTQGAVTMENQKAIIGMPVITSDGQTVGQVLAVGPGENTKDLAFVVKPTAELGAKTAELKIPVDKGELNGRAVQLMVTLADVKKFYVR